MLSVAIRCTLFALYCGMSLPVHAQLRTVETLVPLLIEAIRLDDAQGILGGDAARLVAILFDAQAPIVVTVRKVRSLPGEKMPAGCARLEVTTAQEGVVLPNEDAGPDEPAFLPPADQKMSYQINFCENGRFPEDGGGVL